MKRTWRLALPILLAAIPAFAAEGLVETAAPGPVIRQVRCSEGPTDFSRSLEAEVRGEAPVVRVMAFHRPSTGGGWRAHQMKPLGLGLYETVIRPVDAGTSIVECYLVAVDEQNRVTRLGSSEVPLVVDAVIEESSGEILPVLGIAWFALLAAIGLGGMLRRGRRRRRCWNDGLFWQRRLRPLVSLTGRELAEEVSRLSRIPLAHPLYGAFRWRRAHILEKLSEVKSIEQRARREQEEEILKARAGERREAPPRDPAPPPGAPGDPGALPPPPEPHPDEEPLPDWVAKEMASLLQTLAVQEEDEDDSLLGKPSLGVPSRPASRSGRSRPARDPHREDASPGPRDERPAEDR